MEHEALLKTHIFMRSTLSKQWSIERVFKEVSHGFTSDVDATMIYAPQRSQGIFSRIGIIFWAWRNATTVNHISGDIHFAAFGLPSKSTILTIHDVERLTRTKGIKQFLYRKFWFDWPIKRVRFLTAISQKTKRDLIDVLGCDPDKITVIHNPISADFTKSERPFNELAPRVLHIGTRPNKNLERVIESLAGLSCKLVVVGPITEGQAELLSAHKVEFENLLDLNNAQIIEQYEKCDIVMFPSLFEGFGLVAIEGQASGKPVITSIGSPFDEVVGDTACLVDPKDTQSIRAAVRKIQNDRTYRNNLVEQGILNAERFSANVIAKQYAELYDRAGR